MNPCPCGWYGDLAHTCTCGTILVEHYRARISGPLLDRIDIHLAVPAVPYRELSVERSGEPSAAIGERVNRARRMQLDRFAGRPGLFANAHMMPRDLKKCCQLTEAADALLKTAIARLTLSGRAYHRVLKIARTIADLAGSAVIEPTHVRRCSIGVWIDGRVSWKDPRSLTRNPGHVTHHLMCMVCCPGMSLSNRYVDCCCCPASAEVGTG